MSRQKYQDNCRGCQPAMVDVKTGRVLGDDTPQMKCVMAVWATTTLEQREAWHRFTCLNSRKTHDVRIAKRLSAEIEAALQSIPKEFL